MDQKILVSQMERHKLIIPTLGIRRALRLRTGYPIKSCLKRERSGDVSTVEHFPNILKTLHLLSRKGEKKHRKIFLLIKRYYLTGHTSMTSCDSI